ncbi:DUF58 domain-containing protein [Brumimicrobium salinarum]|uniref:DUF58 domain-containing protein n=1 Tax=Brumimicrobium salinarum TaxID=2058658 RepID=A0A2I0R273_9FLAO|nr:DUF58 domain-containing protein [Brumimicrobium salinarum]PKR80659.1 DUF58 domain-containing protein [Brumimicrobium salinarum]
MAEKIQREYLEQFGNLEVLAKQIVEGFITGMHKSPFHGFSVEFAEHRLYNTGESTKHVDWKLYARTEKLFTKKYEEETNLRCQFVLDTSSSMYFQDQDNWSKLKYSIYGIASLMELLKRQRDAVGLTTFTDKIQLHTENKSSNRHHRFIFSELEKLLRQYDAKTTASTEAVQVLHDVAELCHRRSLIVIFSDMLNDPEGKDELFEALQHLKHNKHEVILFHVVDKAKELDFQLENRPYTLVDMETGEQMKLVPGEVKEHYTKQVENYFKELEQKCGAYGIDFHELDTNQPLNELLVQFLSKRQKMG